MKGSCDRRSAQAQARRCGMNENTEASTRTRTASQCEVSQLRAQAGPLTQAHDTTLAIQASHAGIEIYRAIQGWAAASHNRGGKEI